MRFRSVVEPDHGRVLSVLSSWWAGALGDESPEVRARRQLERSLLLPRLFFQHFGPLSEIAEQEGEIAAFLVGFRSESHPEDAYIHFVGVRPELRGRGVGRALYERFFARAAALGCTAVRSVTSPMNTGSYAFHHRLGFRAEPGDFEVDGRPVKRDYDGPGLDRVAFVRPLGPIAAIGGGE
ncbi:GNAT family N-acetyltransferase [Sorangium sp. So ce1036]|uniref:GNAT family N-acetyltransferase n=1 Tax=Sorangium sp. So ce1036 TaxID=3133328 RepID=UPI003F11D15D